jgi:hypothetical protein
VQNLVVVDEHELRAQNGVQHAEPERNHRRDCEQVAPKRGFR